MKLTQPHKQILHFEFPNAREMTLTFFRVEEHYESRYPNIREQRFTIEDFLETFMSEDGEFTYFYSVYGFNVPGGSFKRFFERNGDHLTRREVALLERVKSAVNYDADDFYIIASIDGDDRTLDHELSHAFYYLDAEYRRRVDGLVSNAVRADLITEFKDALASMGYSEQVFSDEVGAFLCAGKMRKLRKELEVSARRADAIPFRNLFGEFKSRILSGEQR